MPRRTGGRRSYTVTTRKRGRYNRARRAPGDYSDIALDATVRQAAPNQRRRHATAGGAAQADGPAVAIRDEDLHRKVRVRKAANLIVFAVDASWSMAAVERMEPPRAPSCPCWSTPTKSATASAGGFQDRAALVLPPASSVEMAEALRDIPVGARHPSGGAAPGPPGDRARAAQNRIMPLLILLTDGAGNVSLAGMPPRQRCWWPTSSPAARRAVVVTPSTNPWIAGSPEWRCPRRQLLHPGRTGRRKPLPYGSWRAPGLE